MDLMQLMSSRIGLMLDSVGTGMKVSSNKQFIPLLCIIYIYKKYCANNQCLVNMY